jgi:hypothetical protein
MSNHIRTVLAMTAIAPSLRHARAAVPDITTREYVSAVAALLIAEAPPEVVAAALEAAAAEVRRGP